jgi:hypothetical protein
MPGLVGIEWLIPVTVQGNDVKLDIYNENAATIKNTSSE